MTENNTPGIPQEWITVKTLKTISGASLCCWLTTVFFDLICFMPVTNLKLHALLVLIVSTVSCLGLAIYKVSSSRGRKTKVLWMLVIPNAMLIYIHALGFQVASKELAMRANANEMRKEELQSTKAGMSSLLNFFAKQTSWIPSLELTNKAQELVKVQKVLEQKSKILKDSIIDLKSKQAIIPVNSIQPGKSDSISYYLNQYRDCIASNVILKNKLDSANFRIEKILHSDSPEVSALLKQKDSILKKIEYRDALINKWNRIMEAGDMRLQKAEIERIMDGHMGDENYYRKLFRPIIIKGY